METMDKYIEWKNQKIGPAHLVSEESSKLKKELKSPNFILRQAEDILTVKSAVNMPKKTAKEFRNMIFGHYRQLPESTYQRKRALPNIAREFTQMIVSFYYSDLNRETFYYVLDYNVGRPSRMFLLDKVGELLVNEFENSYHDHAIGLDSSRRNMAQFWNFGSNYKIINDDEAIIASENREVSVLDVRTGSVSRVKERKNVEALLELKDLFVFGVEK